jgi:hypothetical protein
MPPLGALTEAWTAAEAALPLGRQVSGLYRFGELWIGLAEAQRSMTTPADRASTPSRHCAG